MEGTSVAAAPAPSAGSERGRGHGRGRGRGRASRGRGRGRGAAARRGDAPAPGASAEAHDTSGGDAAPPAPATRKPRSRKPRGQQTPTNGAPERELGEADAPPPPAPSAAPRRPGKTRALGARLTAPAAAAPVAESVPATVPEYTDLRSRLIAELSSEEYDCVICYAAIQKKQAVWSCARCYTVLHLSCVSAWAQRSVDAMEEQHRLHEDPAVRDAPGQWRCPGCQHARREVPREDRCWCGRQVRPRPHDIPHSCGRRCERGCAWHGCAATTCHPGPCPPCAASVQVRCYCGRERARQVRCSQLRETLPPELADAPLPSLATQGVVSCGAVCGRLLACGVHTCAAACHAGACAPCAERIDAPCFCGRASRSMVCSERPPEAQGLRAAFSCGAPCDAPLACGVHRCTRPCHVRDGVAPCPRDPALVTTCPCGRTPLRDRTDCRDPIPTCGAPCGRGLACGHACAAPCHAGACPPCQEPLTQLCRCGATKRTVLCGQRADDTFECASVCKASRHCGRHQCGRRCCPLAYLATLPKKALPQDPQALDPLQFHACTRVCEKPLSCGRHQCERACHRGACPPCLRSAFTEVSCTCGRTVLEPPVPCGTEVQCSYECALPPPPCGHAKVPHTCHPPSVPCPPCVHLTERACVCGATTLSAVPCSRPRPRCGTPCDRWLACGLHRCPGACHTDGECGPCTQLCGRARPVCGHPCRLPCHPGTPCRVDEPCDAVVVHRCACGHREKMDVCGATTLARDEPSLACTPGCKVAQRNAKIASALGLSVARDKAEYDPALVQYLAEDPRGARAVQDVLNEFVQSPRAAAQLRSLLSAHALRRGLEPPRIHSGLLAFTEQLARAYRLDTEPCTLQGLARIGATPAHAKDADVRIRRARESRMPSVLLTEYTPPPPTRAAAHARHERSRRLATTTAAQTDAPLANAIALLGVSYDESALRAALEPASRGGQRAWTITPAPGAALLTRIRLEPLSLAAVAGRAGGSAAGPWRPIERRYLALCDDVAAAAAAAGASCTAHLARVDDDSVRVYRDGRWQVLLPAAPAAASEAREPASGAAARSSAEDGAAARSSAEDGAAARSSAEDGAAARSSAEDGAAPTEAAPWLDGPRAQAEPSLASTPTADALTFHDDAAAPHDAERPPSATPAALAEAAARLQLDP